MRYTWTGPELFFAPEQVKNEGYSDEIDSWNVGLLIYNMLFGELPFIWPQNTKIKFLLNKIKHKEVQFPEGHSISKCGIDLITKLLDKDFKTRLGLHDILKHPFFS